MTAAARRELIVQSGLSNSLQSLERELGTELYLRGTRPVRLTATGEALLAPAREALRAARPPVARCRRPGTCSWPAPASASLSRRGTWFRSRACWARSCATTRGGQPDAGHRRAGHARHGGDGELDCAIGPALEQRARLRLTSLASEPLALTCRSDHELAGRDR